MQRLKRVVLALAVCLCMPFSVYAEDWVAAGWQDIVTNRTNTALQIWQHGVNNLPDQQLLASLGAYSNFSYAMSQLKKIGLGQSAFIIRSTQRGKILYFVLSNRKIPTDMNRRQMLLADLKQAAGISGQLFAADAVKFKQQPVPDHYLSNKTKQTVWKKVKRARLNIRAATGDIFINRFEISGNERIPTDSILISLREYYGSNKNRSDLKRIRKHVISLYQMQGFYRVRVKVPASVENETVIIRIDESRSK